TAIHKVLDRNTPTIIAGDFIAHHEAFFNSTNHRNDIKGRLLYNLMRARHLTFQGPLFKTYVGGNHPGTPDLTLSNIECNIFHCRITQGNDIGPDHIPIITHLQMTPFHIPKPIGPKLSTLRLRAYHDFLCTDPVKDLDNLPAHEIDTAIGDIHARIQDATLANCDRTNTRTIQQYKPTREIVTKMRLYQQACSRRLLTGQPNLQVLQALRREIIDLTIIHKRHIWGTLVKEANRYGKEPARFWKKIKHLLGSQTKPLSHLTYTYTDETNAVLSSTIEEPQLQANLMGLV
ncbi:hypothetical protein TCON_2678, partial [Astathelohania contejeani]